MISFGIFMLCFLVAGAWLIATRKNMLQEPDRYGEQAFNGKWLILPILIFVVGTIVSMIQPFVVDRVDAGHIGLKVNLTGDDRGVSDYTYRTGWVTYNEWTEMLYEYPTYQQHIEYGDQNVITKGGFSAVINPTFNYSIVPDAVGEMFQELRLDIKAIEQGWLRTAIIGSVQDVANRWEVDKIFNEREAFEAAIVAECNKRVGKWFIVDQLRTNIVPPAALQEAIVNKTKAIQETQAKIQEALVADANAKKMIAIAKGDSAKVVIDAGGKAEAMRIAADAEAYTLKLKNQQITPLMIEYERIQKWNGIYPTTMLGSGSNTLLNLKP
jgi:regulator of protease activity HflC (stomatin/prohibitin superfamily)